jgi:ribosomal protein S18 acetylase RimI-like enzyme
MTDDFLVRRAHPADYEAMQWIEIEAGGLFATIGMTPIAEDAPFSEAELAAFHAEGLDWVAVDAADRPVGYLVGRHVDGRAHLEQVSVRPSFGRRRIGRALVGRLVDRAAREGLPAVTLTTFADVPWNAPYYAKLGFRPFDVDDRSPGLQRIRTEEAGHGLDRWPRVAMIRSDEPAAGTPG